MKAFPIAVLGVERPCRRAEPDPPYYRDDGCEVAPKCIECPLPVCRFELPEQRPVAARYGEIHAARRLGMSVDAIAGRFGVSRRTVFRAEEWAAKQGAA